MATYNVTLTIEDSNVSDYINALERVADRPSGSSDVEFIRIIVENCMSETIRHGLEVVANEAAAAQVNPVDVEVS